MFTKNSRFATLAGTALLGFGLLSMPLAHADNTVQVMNWWTSGSESKALATIQKAADAHGLKFENVPVAGGGGSNAQTVLRARIAAGNPPTAMQMLGLEIHQWAAAGDLNNLDSVAKQEGWNKVVPKTLRWYVTYKGHWVATPVNIHRPQWVWANKAIFDKLHLTIPKTFAEFEADAKKIRAAGYIPLALGGQNWQEANLFENAVLSAGGPKFYRDAVVKLDPKALTSKTMEKAFDQLRAMRKMVDPNFPGRDWNLATAMVINGKAAMQVMGDWAKGEFLNDGKVPGKDFLCFPYPGTAGSFLFNTDAFAMFKVGKDRVKAQQELARLIMSKAVQEKFNLIKGSIPVRTDVPMKNFDACGKESMHDLKQAIAHKTMLPSLAFGYAAPPQVEGAFYDTVSAFFNSDMSSAAAVKQLAQAVDLAK